jgi:hypothetical protein
MCVEIGLQSGTAVEVAEARCAQMTTIELPLPLEGGEGEATTTEGLE